MMRSQKIGTLCFWLTWPGIWLILRFQPRTRIVLQSGDTVLVVRPWLSNGKWSLPGGGIHRSEDPVLSAIRELKEETGVTLKREECTLVDTYQYKQDGLRFRYTLFRAKLPAIRKLIPQRHEIAAAEWVKISELKPLTANQDVIVAVQQLP